MRDSDKKQLIKEIEERFKPLNSYGRDMSASLCSIKDILESDKRFCEVCETWGCEIPSPIKIAGVNPCEGIRRIKELEKDMNKTYNEWEGQDSDIALQILFINFGDTLSIKRLQVNKKLLGYNERSHKIFKELIHSKTREVKEGEELPFEFILESVQSSFFMSHTYKSRASCTKDLAAMSEELETFASTGAFHGDKPVPRIERVSAKNEEYVIHAGRGKPGGILLKGQLAALELIIEDKIPIYKPKQFTCEWEEFPREMKAADLPNFDDVMGNPSNVNYSQIEDSFNELNQLPFKAHLFTMRCKDE